MEEKILQELQNIRIELQGIRSNLEFKTINTEVFSEKLSKTIKESVSNYFSSQL